MHPILTRGQYKLQIYIPDMDRDLRMSAADIDRV